MNLREYIPGMDKDEKILLYFRPSRVFFYNFYLLSAALLVGPLLFLIGLAALGLDPLAAPGRYVTVILLPLYYFVVLDFMFVRWMDLYLDVTVFTDKRIVHIEHHGLLQRNVLDQPLDRVTDASADRRGFLHMVGGYGDVIIQAFNQEITMRNIPKPEQAAQEIIDITRETGKDEEPSLAKSEKGVEAEPRSDTPGKLPDERKAERESRP